VAGATPASASIANGGNTNDDSPVFRFTLSSALGAGESLSVRRAGVPVSVTLSSCGTNCFTFPAPTGLTVVTDVTLAGGATLPAYTTAAFQSLGSASFTVRVVDLAGNESAATPAYSVNVGYFPCDQNRANTTYNAVNSYCSISFASCTVDANCAGGGGVCVHPNHTTISTAAASATTCNSCHTTGPNPPLTGTPAGFWVAVPSLTPAYWCRRPN
jgi:hypothetical protein